MLYCAVNPLTDGTAGKTKAELQVLAGAVIVRLGNTTKLFVSVHPGLGVVYVALKQPAVDGVKTPVVGLIVPPPLTVHVPPVAPTVCVNVTFPCPIQEFTTATIGKGLTVTIKVSFGPGQLTPPAVYIGVTIIVPDIGDVPVLVAVPVIGLEVPEAGIPIAGLLLVHCQEVAFVPVRAIEIG
jgi:hypothetical protein